MRNLDPRSKLHRTNKNGKHIDLETGMEKQSVDAASITVPNVVIVATVIESSSWGGQKFDGYVYLPSVDALNKYRDHLQRHKSHEEYNFIQDIRLSAVSSDCIQAMTDKITDSPDKPWLWTNTGYMIKLWS